MSNKQSSVEYLIEHLLPKALTVEQYYHIEKAKAMHKGEVVKAFICGDASDCLHEDDSIPYAELYYNETYGGGNK
jgi:hypothetical protein